MSSRHIQAHVREFDIEVDTAGVQSNDLLRPDQPGKKTFNTSSALGAIGSKEVGGIPIWCVRLACHGVDVQVVCFWLHGGSLGPCLGCKPFPFSRVTA